MGINEFAIQDLWLVDTTSLLVLRFIAAKIYMSSEIIYLIVGYNIASIQPLHSENISWSIIS